MEEMTRSEMQGVVGQSATAMPFHSLHAPLPLLRPPLGRMETPNQTITQ
ncbi:hypothetical protein [Segatella buccae]|nr:hypothetical protein [Segatella buccae]